MLFTVVSLFICCLTPAFSYVDIDRTYGQRKPIAMRTPLFATAKQAMSPSSPPAAMSPSVTSPLRSPGSPPPIINHHRVNLSLSSSLDGSTPGITEAESGTETETDADAPEEIEDGPLPTNPVSRQRSSKGGKRSGAISQHDLNARYFRKDVLGLYNIDLLR